MSNFKLSEDWTAALLGLAVILLITPAAAVPSYAWAESGDLSSKVISSPSLLAIVKQFGLVVMLTGFASYGSGKNVLSSLKVVTVLFVMAQLALLTAGNAWMKSYNLEPVIFSLLLGLLASHIIKIPDTWRTALSSEWHIKVGLVLLGTTVIFSDLLKAGSLGLIQAVIVVFSVWYVCYWICQKLKLDDELTFMLSSAVSICGVSAAIATAGAIKGDPKKLSYVISLVLITAIPMMIGMPYLAQYMGLSQEVTGAWLGGTIDTTGAVAAAGTIAGETALKMSTIVKFSQNVLLGVAAFVISVYWTYSKKNSQNAEKPTIALIWDRFPKFLLGFIGASLLFSFALSTEAVASIKDPLKSIQTLFFVMGFSAIGLETKFSDIFNASNQKPLVAFLMAQGFNILITLGVALLLFGKSVS